MSSEEDLLDQLMGQDECLYLVLLIFSAGENLDSLLEKVRRAVTQQLKDGFIEVKQKTADLERILPEWEAKQILAADEHWLKRGEEAEYYLSLTEKGCRRVR